MPASVKRRLDAIPQLRYPLGVTGVWFEAPLKLRYHFACNRMSVEFVNEIIGLLSTDGGSITEALLKTKVLLFDIGHEELVEWVKDELGGYDSGKIVPAYRIVPARVLGNLVNMRMRATSHPIPLNHLSEDERDALESIHVRESLSTIAEFVNANPESDTLRRPLPLEFNSILSTGLSQGTHLEQAWCAISKFNMGNVIFQVKSRLLDFMLELKQTSSFTNRDTVSAKRSVPFDAVSSFNNAIFGSNTTIVIGNNKIGSISNQIATGDFSNLADRLRSLGVDEAALKKLREAINAENAEGERPSLTGRIGTWLGEQISRSAAGAFTVGVDKFAPAVIDAVKSHLGL